MDLDVALQEVLNADIRSEADLAAAKALGFVISADDLKQAQAEVSDEELEGAAGENATQCDVPLPCPLRDSQ